MSTHIRRGTTALSRRDLLKGLSIGAIGAGLSFGLNVQQLAAQDTEMASTVFAFYRFQVGDFEVLIINDGLVGFPPNIMVVNADEGDVTTLLQEYSLDTDFIPLPMSTVLIRNQDRAVLVDTGAGTGDFNTQSMGPNIGGLAATMSMLGISPDDVTDVILSHYHPDHVGGIALNGTAAFPNAQYYLPQMEWDFLQSEDVIEFLVPFVGFANDQLQPISSNEGQLQLFGDEDELIPGIQAVATLGHSIGHHSFLLESNGQQLMLVADSITHPVLSLHRPDWVSGLDQIPEQTVETRLHLLNRIVEEQIPIMAYHFPFPGIGNVTRDGDLYRFTPTG